MLKVGNTVLLRNDLVDGVEYGKEVWVDEMLKGVEVTISYVDGDFFNIEGDDYSWVYTKEMIADDQKKDNTHLGEQAPDTSEFISLDYRTEYHNKVAECEKLKAQVEYLWKQVLGE